MPQVSKPAERKSRLGNPGKEKLPPIIVALPQVEGIPEPLRTLGAEGRRTWDRVWTAGAYWVAGQTDIEIVQMLAECVDERMILRAKVFTGSDWRDRVALRNLEEFTLRLYSILGFSPTDRSKLGVGQVRAASVLDELRARREKL